MGEAARSASTRFRPRGSITPRRGTPDESLPEAVPRRTIGERGCAAVDLDLVVAKGSVIDGEGTPPFHADVGVRRGRIEVVSRDGGIRGSRVVDATGLVVAPGFIDMDSHADWAVAHDGAQSRLARWLRQGVTTVIGGACGFSPAPVLPKREEVVAGLGAFLCDGAFVPRWQTFAEFLDVVESAGVPLNIGFLVGQNTLQAQAMESPTTPTPAALGLMLEQTRDALRAGAFGFSANVGFVPGVLARTDDLQAIARVVAREDGIFAAHARAYTRFSPAYRPSFGNGAHNVRAVRELLDLARRTGVRLHLLHLGLAGRRTWRTRDEVLGRIDAAAADGVDVAFDAAPYTVVVGPLQLLFPSWYVAKLPDGRGDRDVRKLKWLGALQRPLLGLRHDDVRLRSAGAGMFGGLERRSFAQIGAELGMGAVECQIEVARRVGMNGASVLLGRFSGDAEDDASLRTILSHRRCVVGTNAASTRTGPQNPSATGAFPRFLGRYVRDLGIMSLHEAVRRMTSLPAARLGLKETGRIAEGCWADLTLFDPREIRDAADPERADAVPSGIRAVLVSGVPVLEDGVVKQGVLPGRVLRRRAA